MLYSTNVQLWPILCNVQNFEPFIVAVFCGNRKPDPVEEYMDDLLSELKDLMQMLLKNGTESVFLLLFVTHLLEHS